MHPPPNWFADGQHILVLGGGVVIFAGQVVTFWRSNVTNQRVAVLQTSVAVNDCEILGELSKAQASLNKVIETLTTRPERRKADGPTFMVGGRRSGDSPPPA